MKKYKEPTEYRNTGGDKQSFVVGYIGLPDMQYRDVPVLAFDTIEARSLADIELLGIYGMDNFDCLGVWEGLTHNLLATLPDQQN